MQIDITEKCNNETIKKIAGNLFVAQRKECNIDIRQNCDNPSIIFHRVIKA